MAHGTPLLRIWAPLVLALTACGESGSVTPPPTTPTPTPQSTPSGNFAVVASNPAFGGTVRGSDSDLQGVTSLQVTFHMTYSESIPDFYFVLQLLNGSTECLRSQIAYSTRLDPSPPRTYTAGTTAGFQSYFFVRDNQQPSCGASFTTNRVRLVVEDIDPVTGQPRRLLTQEASGGWTFVFAR